jgi:hypothetical protein
MKAISKIFIFLFLLTALYQTGCRKKLFFEITYEGVVYDTLGGSPVAGITVILDACKSPRDSQSECFTYTVGTAITDVNGHFKIQAREARSNRYHVMAGSKSLSTSYNTDKDMLKSPEYTIIYLK